RTGGRRGRAVGPSWRARHRARGEVRRSWPRPQMHEGEPPMRRTATAALAIAGLLGLATFGPAPAQEPAEKAKELLAQVEKLAKERQYEEAADVVNKLL